jgi:superfamily II DNA or RNA helicase
MQSATTVRGVSFGQDLRSGHYQVFEHDALLTGSRLNVQLPTGYGKTFAACGAYSIRQHASLSTRLLYVVPRDSQLNQFVEDGPYNLGLAGLEGPCTVDDIRFYPLSKLLRDHRDNKCQVFAITVQSLCERRGYDACRELMQIGQWMIVIDEHQHYGLDKSWGRVIRTLPPYSFLLAMSATPYRPTEDSAFGKPDISLSYREGCEEGCLKPLHGHAYHYRIDAIDESGDVKSYTTEELTEAAGGTGEDRIERFRVERKMRWSPKYVSPLVRVPIERMEQGCQALISAMCVSHADLVCQQLRGMFPELRIDWVGTGEFGRSDEENKDVLNKFCPPKDDFGVRVPELDVLVHVGIAGEGLDATNVSEVVFLRPGGQNNRDNQVIGRGARIMKGRDVTCHVNFDASTEMASNGYIGENIMDAIDGLPKKVEESKPPDPDYPAPPPLPIEPYIQIYDMELLRIDSGGVQRMAEALAAAHKSGFVKDGIDLAELRANPSHPVWNTVEDLYRMMRRKEAERYNEQSFIRQWRDAVEQATRNITGLTLSLMQKNGTRIERTLVGDIKKRLNWRKKTYCGSVENTVESCKTHYDWLQALGKQMRESNKIPGWLQ